MSTNSNESAASTHGRALTPKFNAPAARPKRKIPASKERIKQLKKKLSRQAHTAELTPLGNVNGSYDPKRDRKIRHEIKAVEKKLAKRRNLAKTDFTKAQLKNSAKRSFNRSARFEM